MLNIISNKLHSSNIHHKIIKVKNNYNDIFEVLLLNEKVIFFLQFEDVNQIVDFMTKIPTLKDVIKENILEENSYENGKITVPAFLWDLYIAAFAKNGSVTPNSEIHKIEQDNFVAKKVVILYDDEDDILKQFLRYFCPEIQLDEFKSNSLHDIVGNHFANLNDNQEYIKLLEYILGKEKENFDVENIVNYLNYLEGVDW